MSQPLTVNLAFLPEKPTGLATYAINLLPHLAELQPTLIAAQPRPGFTCHPAPTGLTHEQGRQGHFARLRWTQLQLPGIYRQLHASLLFSPIPEAPLWSGCRFVETVHDLIPLRFFRKFTPLWTYQRYYLPRVLQQAAHIITNSQATAQDVIDFFGVPATKLTPILLAHDAANFRPLDLPLRPYFLYLGRNDPYKNLDRVVTAFAQLRDRSSQCREYELWLAGPADPRYQPDLQALIDQLGITAQVKFLSYVPYAELPVLLNQAIALVMPSLWEGFGLPVLEAMACGTPVITSNLSSLPEVTGDAALLVDPYEVGAIADAMHHLVTDDGFRTALSVASRDRASHFSWATTGRHTADLLRHDQPA